MAKVSVSIPDEVVDAAKAAGLNISQLATAALTAELDRRDKMAALDRYLDMLESELGPLDEDESREAAEWAARFDEAAADPAERPPRSA